MKLKKCSLCGKYNLEEKCKGCGAETKDAHYKFVRLREVSERKLK
jgi:rRNA maturation protein Nop10